MSVRSSGYDSDILDQVLCCFMRTILRLQESGVEKLPVENHLPEPLKSYMKAAMGLFTGGEPPEITRIILEAEYDVLLHNLPGVDIETVMGLQMIKELSFHIRFDDDYYRYLLDTCNLWGNTALEYACLTFYPKLPDEIREKYGVNDLIRFVPREKMRLEDY